MEADCLVVSPDGTPISYRQSGAGPPLVLVHGTGADRWTFRFIEPILARQFTVCAVDRRGRSGSGDSTGAYRIEQEFADIAAVVDSLPRPASLFGHSYGATVALGAARLSRNLRALILYEPTPGIPCAAPEFLDRLDALLAEGKREELLSTVMVEFAGLGPEELERFKSAPWWKSRVEAAHTIPREVRAEEGYKPPRDAFAGVLAPAVLLLGSESPDWARRGTEVAQSLLANSQVVVLEGHGHVATMTAPDLLSAEVARFLTTAASSASP